MRQTFLTDKDRSELEAKIAGARPVLATATLDNSAAILTAPKEIVAEDGLLICYTSPGNNVDYSSICINGEWLGLYSTDEIPTFNTERDWFSTGDVIVALVTTSDEYGLIAVLVGVLKEGSGIKLTPETIIQGLGYTPANADAISKIDKESVIGALGYTPASLSTPGISGQFAISDGNGGIAWKTIHSAEGVAY